MGKMGVPTGNHDQRAIRGMVLVPVLDTECKCGPRRSPDTLVAREAESLRVGLEAGVPFASS